MAELLFTPAVYPPLGRSTAVKVESGKIRLYAFMTVSTGVPAPSTGQLSTPQDPASQAKELEIRAEDRFTVLLWYSEDGRGIWKPARFQELLPGENDGVKAKFFDLQRCSSDTKQTRRQDVFWLDLPWSSREPVEFCLKYSYGDGPWLWEGVRIGYPKNGRLLILPPDPPLDQPSGSSQELGSDQDIISMVFPDLRSIGKWSIDRLGCDNSGIGAWCISRPAAGATRLELGPPADLESWMALVKIATPWMGPRHGGKFFDCPFDALLLLLQRKYGPVVLVLPVSASEGTRYVQSDSEGKVVIRVVHDASNDSAKTVALVRVIIALGTTAQQALDIGMAALKVLVHQGATGGDTKELKLENPGHALKDVSVSQQRPSSASGEDSFPVPQSRIDWEKGLSYCTWNGLGWDLSEDRVLGALQHLDDANIHVRNLLIDDNWQSLDGRNYGSSGTWNRFEANEKFPNGLRGCVEKVRQRFPYIKHIGVWHALHGYWDGITRAGELAYSYKTVDLSWRDNVNQAEKKLCFIHPEEINRFYDDFYSFLSRNGVDCAKVDVQSRIDELMHEEDRGFLQQPYLDALRTASAKHLGSRIIYCMAHVPQALYYALLPSDGPRRMFRTSDDFYPNVPASHSWHIFANAQNMLLFSRLHIFPDWDMFQTTLPIYGPLHAVARCLSGGPIYITDTPGKHDSELLTRMCAPAPNGTTVALQPEGMAVCTDPFLAYDDGHFLCVHTRTVQCNFLGVFNISTKARIEPVECSSLYENLSEQGNGQVVIRSFSTGKITTPLHLTEDVFLVTELMPSAWDVYTAFPLRSMRWSSDENVQVAVLGLVGQFTGGAVVERWQVVHGDNADTLEVELNALGVLGIYVAGLRERDIHRLRVHLNKQRINGEHLKLSAGATVLEVSVREAWAEMGLRSEKLTCLVHLNVD